ncbi:ISAs1 family transposase [Sulfurimonas sediminis]|uniref:ISAs1 family transposase n=1 Tax=Sulfurimonas sediminis TaxID=2590020 RepID=A0A7M1B3F8_9BACT|nr:ISAs1 family transposase [Sulfurimonas sediminis]QOP42479.1 ISAs1 family transposase [Sulfurimonas sediminis]QOP42582.1 ISAs1 family transposase [Sulfurimonas sediminis]QOP42783.1 ISAs1 family transposase [Sulfurimonas sediminis]QOP43205.1 ISAs1 family transposase [Sulfurimonas sediminis]QOP43216.1 ISAs1 family transposase [Sulfurimonas sediminis]
MATKTREKLAKKRSIRGYADQAQSNQLLKLFSEVTDYRKPQGKRHRLEHILYLSVLAGLMGATDYKQISIWIEKHIQKEQVKRLLGVEFILTPKKSLVSDVLAKVDSQEVEVVFRKWIRTYVDTRGKHLSVDGKVMNGSKYKDKRSIEVVGAVLSEIGVIIAHQQIAEKSNEIPALQAMIGELGDEFIFTFDAMNTQKNS